MNLLSLALSLFVTNYTYTSECGSNPLFTVVSQSLNPEYPRPGDTVEWTVNYSVTEYMEVLSPRNVFYGVRNDITSVEALEYDLCEEIDCPITVGTHSHTNLIIWPSSHINTLTLTSEWIDEYDNELMCTQMIHIA
jgi:hypothetical protein